MNLKATSFATRQDLANFGACVTRGGSVQDCLNVGDNGVGAWGDPTWEPNAIPPIVAMPSPTPKHALVNVTMNGKTVECIVKDRSPHGVVDLSPSALKAFGLDPDTELLTQADVEIQT
jgi:hypothetical protein